MSVRFVSRKKKNVMRGFTPLASSWFLNARYHQPGPVAGWYRKATNSVPVDEMRRAGARYFASQYAYGMQNHPSIRQYLDTHGALIEGTPDWAIYALRPPASAGR